MQLRRDLEGDVVSFFFHQIKGGTQYSPEFDLLLFTHDEWLPVGDGGESYPNGDRYHLTSESVGEDDRGRSANIGRVFAHEMGHKLILGPLSPSRLGDGGFGGGHTMIDGRPWDGGHDVGVCPSETWHLMNNSLFKSGKWLRHEDWEMAGREASRIVDAR